ncbi:hypothetical protein [Undibacterium sp.]|uniref:hypothetical protein n=1 Tax=Undibacterium sp. TaxID=1914977 RepID=UPI0025F514B9|nr:hypothetical protein [Undibacterium sp.]
MTTEKVLPDAVAFMEQMYKDSITALKKHIENKVLVTSKELQDLLQVTPRFIDDAVRDNRLFEIAGPAGEKYYPAFYADVSLDRHSIEKVCEALYSLPPTSKFHFFTSKSTYLGIKTPLEALKEGRLANVLAAATGYAER